MNAPKSTQKPSRNMIVYHSSGRNPSVKNKSVKSKHVD